MQVIWWPEDLLRLQIEGGSVFAVGEQLAPDFWVILGFEQRHCANAIGQIVLAKLFKDSVEILAENVPSQASSLSIVIDPLTLLPLEVHFEGKQLKSPNFVLYAIPRPALFEFYSFPEVEPLQSSSILQAAQKQFGKNCIRSKIGFCAVQLINSHFGAIQQQQQHQRSVLHLESSRNKSHLIRNLSAKKNALMQLPKWNIQSINLAFFLAVDALIGSVVALCIANYLPNLPTSFSTLRSSWSIGSYKNLMNWLMGWPAGFKLNNNLNKFLGEMFLWMLSVWEVLVYSSYKFSFDSIAVATAYYSAIVGISSLFAAMQDILGVITLHLQFMHFVSSKIYKFQVFSLFNLVLLFRGMKWNDLRKRYDYANYDTDQLLIGTILFTVLAYLFPTVLVYFLSFLLTTITIKGTSKLLSFFQQFCTHFPYWQWICKFSGKQNSIPYTITFEPLLNAEEINFFRLKSVPLSCIQILTNHISAAISGCQVQK